MRARTTTCVAVTSEPRKRSPIRSTGQRTGSGSAVAEVDDVDVDEA